MKILFLYPLCKNIPNGGLKVIYDYANRLVQDGFKVGIAYAAYFDSIVTHDVPPHTIVAGIPAKKIGERNSELLYSFDGVHRHFL